MSAGVAERWYESPFTGVLRRFGSVPPEPHDPDVAIFGGEVACAAAGFPSAVSGAGWTDAAAEGACVGEAIERWQLAAVPNDGLVEASLAGWPLDEPALRPEDCVLFHAEQYASPGFPYAPFTPETTCRWVCCRRLDSGTPVWAPEELVYVVARAPHDAWRPLAPSISTGLAAGRRDDPVTLRGLQEVIERDAIMGMWWERYACEEWEEEAVLALLPAGARERLWRPNLRYRFYRVDTPFSAHVTIITSEGEDREGFCASIGGACRETRAASWTKAVLEAVQGRSYVRHLRRAGGRAPAGDPVPRTFAEHALFYSLHPERLAETPLRRARAAGAAGEPERQEGVAALLERLGPRRPVLVRHMTPVGIAAADLGWCVARVLVPSLQPLHGDHRLPHLGGPLWAPRTWRDWAGILPHPFA